MEGLLNEGVSQVIRKARRQLESIPGYELLEDFSWNAKLELWVMRIRLRCKIESNEFVQEITEWHVALSQNYPEGVIKFYPDKIRGIKSTFQHQNYNAEINDQPFLSGDPCLDTKQGSWGRKSYSLEPRGIDRLSWHVIRCIQWINDASANLLFQPGDPFELPQFPVLTKYRIVFNEDDNSYQRWLSAPETNGLLDLRTLGQSPQVYAVLNFLRLEKNEPKSKWGKYISGAQLEDQTGIWVKCNQLPVMKPWQVPNKIGELIKVLSEQGIDIKKEVYGQYCKLKKKGKTARFVMIGFPVSNKIGEPNSLIHWFAIELQNPPPSKGFRNSEILFAHELSILLSPERPIKWVKTENWSRNQLTRRGSLGNCILNSNVLLIGNGAIGSILGEQLVRLGVENITLVDDEKLNAGNLSRHSLTLVDIENYKAEALSRKLNLIFPFVTAHSETNTLQDVLKLKPEFFNQFDLIIDATGDDNVLNFSSQHLSNSNKTFVSVSSGYNADRFYCLTFKGSTPGKSITEIFIEKCTPWINAERAKIQSVDEEILDAIGCWHPLFPARLDDLYMLAGASVKVIESNLKSHERSIFTVIEKQSNENGQFTGIRIIGSE